MDGSKQEVSPEVMYMAMAYVAHTAGRYSWRTEKITCEPETFERLFTELMKYEYAEEIFVETEQPIGHAFYDRNAKYIKP